MADDEKDILRAQLESSLVNGGLQQALAAEAAEVDLEEVRLQLQASFIQSVADGSMEEALKKAFTEHVDDEVCEDAVTIVAEQPDLLMDQAQVLELDIVDDAQLLQLKERVARRLEAAYLDGSLESALEVVRSVPSASDGPEKERTKYEGEQKHSSEELREVMAEQLLSALADGSLEAALAQNINAPVTPVPEKDASEDHMEALRTKVASQLEMALGDGSLEEALTFCSTHTEPFHKTEDWRDKTADAATGEEVEALRKKLAIRFEASVADGSLEAVLFEQAEARDARNADGIREKLGSQLAAAFNDGSLEAALEANAASAEAEASDALRCKLAESLTSSFLDGSLELALSASLQVGAASMAPSMAPSMAVSSYYPTGASSLEVTKSVQPERPPSGKPSRGAAALLQVLSSYDRRIGKVMASIDATEGAIRDRIHHAELLQVQIRAAQGDLQGLNQVWEKQQAAINAEEVRDVVLQEERQRVAESLELEKLKNKHAAVEMDAQLHSARSELASTAPSAQDTGASRQGSPLTSWR